MTVFNPGSNRVVAPQQQITGGSGSSTIFPGGGSVVSGRPVHTVGNQSTENIVFTPNSDITWGLSGMALTASLVSPFITINGTRVDLGQSITISSGGGGGNTLPTEHVNVGLSVTEREVGSSAVTVTATLSVNSPYTFVGTGSTGGSSGTDTIIVRDGNSNTISVTHSGLTANTFTFSLSQSLQASAQTITVSGTLTASYQSVNYTAPFHATIEIRQGWYQTQATSQPANVAAMTNQGVFHGTETANFTSTVSGGRTAYVALPRRSGGYSATSGQYIIPLTQVVATFDTNYTLYSIADAADGVAGTVSISITEA